MSSHCDRGPEPVARRSVGQAVGRALRAGGGRVFTAVACLGGTGGALMAQGSHAAVAAGQAARFSGSLPARPPDALRVCADPNNLPFSNRAGAGFENRIAELIARQLHRPLRYEWWAQRRGFLRHTLDAGRCDLVIGMPAAADRILATAPYYTSSYVFLTRRSRGPPISSLDDPRLRHLRIGLHFIGDDYHNTPAAAALARRGIVRNLVGYSIYGDYSKPNPPAALVDAVAAGQIDVAIVWGPFAGYFGPRTGVPLVSAPVSPAIDGPGIQFRFPIAAGVRRGDSALRAEVDHALATSRPAVEALLAKYGVPLACPRHGAKEPSCG